MPKSKCLRHLITFPYGLNPSGKEKKQPREIKRGARNPAKGQARDEAENKNPKTETFSGR